MCLTNDDSEPGDRRQFERPPARSVQTGPAAFAVTKSPRNFTFGLNLTPRGVHHVAAVLHRSCSGNADLIPKTDTAHQTPPRRALTRQSQRTSP